MNPLERTRLEKAAADCGFELTPELLDGGLILRSAQFPEFIAVVPCVSTNFNLYSSVNTLLPTTSDPRAATNGWHALVRHSSVENLFPTTSTPIKVVGWEALYQVLDKAAATARTMSNRIALKFYLTTETMPKTTEAECLVVKRVGQDLFRSALLDYWQGRCCVTGLAVPELLRASHSKPWAKCDSDEERLDVFNGFLLAPHLDALFDDGWVTFCQEGRLVVSASLPQVAMELLGVVLDARIHGMKSEHFHYLKSHRQLVFREPEMN